MTYAQSPGQHALSDINITPLVDVMLVLLVIFMIAAPLITHNVKIALPETDHRTHAAGVPSPRPVTVSVTEDGRLFFNDAPVSREQLGARLAVEAQKTPQPGVNIRGDKTAPYRYVNEVVNIAQMQGMRSIGFVSIKPRH